MNQFDVTMEKQRLYYGRKITFIFFSKVLAPAITVRPNRLSITNFVHICNYTIISQYRIHWLGSLTAKDYVLSEVRT
jgi:hypothetical protein